MRRLTGLVAWTSVIFAAAGAGLATWLYVLTPGASNYIVWGAAMAVSFPVVGALVIARQPKNAVAWIFLTIGLVVALQSVARSYAPYGLLVAPGPAAGADSASWVMSWLWVPGFGLFITFALLLFPNGRLPSRGWRWVALAAAASIVGLSLDLAISSWPARGPALLDPDQSGSPVVAAWFAGLLTSGIASATSLVVRFRRSRGEERQQLKWVAYAGAVTVAVVVPAAAAVQGGSPLLLAALALPLVPLAAGFAILRYRLYDIDRLISRTVIYGLVTGLLASLYVIGVVALGRLLAPVTEGSQLAVAGSTLAVAAAFGPVRRRVQALVDRRFNRARYDAARTIDDWRARLRRELDLEELSDDLLSVIHKTMQPRAASLWLARHEGRR